MSDGVRCRVIAVRGSQGSPGCSWLVAALGRAYARRRLETLLIDADAEGGTLIGDFGGEAGDDGTSLGRLVRLGALSAAHLAKLARPVAGGLRIVEARLSADFGSGGALVEASRQEHAAVIIDLGHRIERLQQELQEASDWNLWVVRPDRSGLERADRALAAERRPPHGGIVVNMSRGGLLPGAGRFLSERHGLPVLARLDRGRGWRARRQVDRLAALVHPEMRLFGRPWL